jgi:hypothetical protein
MRLMTLRALSRNPYMQGGSKTQTKALHQAVVAVVFVSVGAIAAHLLLFLL